MAKENNKHGIVVKGGTLFNQNGETSKITRQFSAQGLSGVVSTLRNINPNNVGAQIEFSVNGQPARKLALELVPEAFKDACEKVAAGVITETHFVGCKKGLVRNAKTGHHIPGVEPNDLLRNYDRVQGRIAAFIDGDNKKSK